MLNLLLHVSICVILTHIVSEFILLLAVLSIPKNKPLNKPTFEGVSVIVCARNEAENLKENLESILLQDYPIFEVIVVNDNSNDHTHEVLTAFSSKYPQLKILDIETGNPSKKNAISIGVHSAIYNTLCFTDADCKPTSTHWLSQMAAYISKDCAIVLGYSPYHFQPSIVNYLIRYETLQTAVNYFGLSRLGMSYMGVGRNLCYKKVVFNAIGGFNSHEDLKSGDDDLFINEASTHYKIGLCLDELSFVYSQPKTSFKDWIHQKRRHISTSGNYKLWHKMLLSFQFLVRVLFWYFSMPLLFFYGYKTNEISLFSFIIIAVVASKMLFLFINFKSFKTVKTIFLNPITEILLTFFQGFIFISHIFKPSKNW